MSEDQELFDRSLLRRRRARFAGETAEHEFLLSHVAAEIAERIGAILRDFPLALDLGAYHGLLGRAVAALPSVGEMIYAESVPALAARCPRPAVVCDEELLPFKEMSLSLVASGLALHRVNDLPGALIQIRRSLRPDGLFMMARAACVILSGPASAASPASRLVNLDGSSGSPITPVEAIYTSASRQPAAAAAASAVSFTASRPRLPVKALALPELTTSALAIPCSSLERHHSTGADAVFDLVSTPATVVPGSNSASKRSVRPG